MNAPYHFRLYDSAGTVLSVIPVDLDFTHLTTGDTVTFSVSVVIPAEILGYWQHEPPGDMALTL